MCIFNAFVHLADTLFQSELQMNEITIPFSLKSDGKIAFGALMHELKDYTLLASEIFLPCKHEYLYS